MGADGELPSIHGLPGIFLVRETGFPTTRFDFDFEIENAQAAYKEEVAGILFETLVTYFENDLIGGNPFITATRNLLDFQTSPNSNGADALAYVVDGLLTRLVTERTGFFSTHFVASQLDKGQVVGERVQCGLGSPKSLT